MQGITTEMSWCAFAVRAVYIVAFYIKPTAALFYGSSFSFMAVR